MQADELRPHPVGRLSITEAARLLRRAALARALDEPDWVDRIVPLLRGRFALREHTVDLAVDSVIREAAHDVLTHGWTPTEMYNFAARRLDPAALSYLVDALAGTAQWTVRPPWLSELRNLTARVWWTTARPHIAQWSARHDRSRAETLRAAVDVAALLAYLPRTDRPQTDMPGRVQLPPDAVVGDERVAGRIDALLALATGTDFTDEAATCVAKAQDLMRRHATVPAVRRRAIPDPRRLIRHASYAPNGRNW